MLLKFFETLFYFVYIPALSVTGVILIYISNSYAQFLSGVMTLVMVIAECFFIFPRVAIIWHKRTVEKAINMGKGRQINSILFTFVFILLWNVAILLLHPYFPNWVLILFYSLCLSRIILCLFPQNRWKSIRPPLSWTIIRNIPYFITGLMICYVFFWGRNKIPAIQFAWLALLLSLIFWVPRILLFRNKAVEGILIIPRALCFLWILAMFIYI